MTARICGPQGQPCPSNCGIDCDFQTAELKTPHDKAAWHFWEPDAPLHIQAFDKPSLRIRVLDWLGNLPHRFGRWVDRTAAGKRFCVSVGAVTACALAALVVMR